MHATAPQRSVSVCGRHGCCVPLMALGRAGAHLARTRPRARAREKDGCGRQDGRGRDLCREKPRLRQPVVASHRQRQTALIRIRGIEAVSVCHLQTHQRGQAALAIAPNTLIGLAAPVANLSDENGRRVW